MGDGVPSITRYTFIDDTARSFCGLGGRRGHRGDPSNRGRTTPAKAPRPHRLSTRCDDFRTRWGAHNVRRHGSGVKHFHHPVVGDLTFTYEGLEVTEDPGLQFLIYTAEPASPTTDALRLLGSWAASQSWSPHLLDGHAAHNG